MPNPNIEGKWNKGESGNPNGRPKGSKNRSTIARKWLETIQSAKNPITGDDEKLTAYKQLMDSGYGMPTQQIEHTGEQPIFTGINLDVEK
jgi:hypothetical protein